MVHFAEFEVVPEPQVTASKLMTNFLHIRPNMSARRKRAHLTLKILCSLWTARGRLASVNLIKERKH